MIIAIIIGFYVHYLFWLFIAQGVTSLMYWQRLFYPAKVSWLVAMP